MRFDKLMRHQVILPIVALVLLTGGCASRPQTVEASISPTQPASQLETLGKVQKASVSEVKSELRFEVPTRNEKTESEDQLIPLMTLAQVLDAPHQQLAAFAHSFHLNTKSDELLDEDSGKIETCYRQSIESSVALCKISPLEANEKSGANAKIKPAVFLLVRGEDANTREYSRIVEQSPCEHHHIEEILSGTSTECITVNLKITLQKRIYQQGEVGYQIYVERPESALGLNSQQRIPLRPSGSD